MVASSYSFSVKSIKLDLNPNDIDLSNGVQISRSGSNNF